MEPLVVSIRSDPESKPSDFPASLAGGIYHLPQPEQLEAEAKKLRAAHGLPRRVAKALGRWGAKGDKMRAYEAIHLASVLKARGIRHVHAHFAGMAARAAFWLHRFHGFTFSLTGHANDIFCEQNYPVSLEQLVTAARFVVTETDFSRDWLVSRFPKAGRKVFRVYNGIDASKFVRTDRERVEGVFKIISVGRYIEKKGFEFLIDACGALRDQGFEFRCEIIGEGPLREKLAAQIDRLGLGGQICLAGPRSQPEIIPLLSAASVFVLPCVKELRGGMDNLPTVIMEAMAAGLPVVSTGIAGVPEMVVNGETGWIVAERDSAAIARALLVAAGDREIARRLGDKARDRAASAFALGGTVRRLKHLLVAYGRVDCTRASVTADPELKSRERYRKTGLGFWLRDWEKKI